MKKTIIILLMISIITCIFADNVVFEEGQQDSIKKQEQEGIVDFMQGVEDGKICAKWNAVFFLLGLTGIGMSFATYYLLTRRFVPPEELYQKESIEYKLGFNEGYDEAKRKKASMFLTIGFVLFLFVILYKQIIFL